MTTDNQEKILIRCIKLILRPVVRICLRQSIKIQELTELCKTTLVEIAEEELIKAGKTASLSRLSVITGVHRREVARIVEGKDIDKDSYSLISRIIGQWQQDPKFRTKGGKARVLSYEGVESEFVDLVRSVSRDVNPYTVLFELERIKAVEKTRTGLKLCSRLYIPKNMEEGYVLLGKDSDDLISAVHENIVNELDIPNLHIKTEYDNIPAEHISFIRKWFYEEGSAFHQKARNFLSRFDRDSGSMQTPGQGRFRVAVGSFSITEDLENQENLNKDEE